MHRRSILFQAAAATIGLTAAPLSRAQAGPTRVVLGFTPGGSVDSLARLVADSLAAHSGRPAIVDNKAGAAGRIAVDFVKQAAPDGETLLVAPQGPMTLFTHVFKDKLRYDPARDFSPITRLATGDFALTLGPLSGARDLAGFRAWLRSAGEKANFGSPGAGTLPHFVGVVVAQKLGTPMTHVPYPGSAKSMIDLAGGTLAATVSPVTEALELHKAGRVRIVAITGGRRSPFVPEVPTFREQGIDLEVPLWFALYGPAGMPAATVDRIRSAVDRDMGGPDAIAKLAKLGLEPAPLAPAALEALRQRETALWEPAVRASGFTPSD